MKKIYLHTSQIPGFIECLMERHPSVVADHPKCDVLCRELRTLTDNSPHWERWRPLTEALMIAEEQTWEDGTVPDAWMCPHCHDFNVDAQAMTVVPLCGTCDQPVEWNEAYIVVFDKEEATE